MGFKCGIVGLPNVGKSTLFNALTSAEIAAENYPFCTVEPNVGIVPVPDERLTKISDIVKPKKTIPTTMEFFDIAGLVAGASKGEGLGNKFLANIRETQAIAHVVRCFEDDNVTHVAGRCDPLADIETIQTELLLADMDTVQRASERIARQAKSGAKDIKMHYDYLLAALAHLGEGLPIRSFAVNNENEKQWLYELHLLTGKPVLYVANGLEGADENDPLVAQVKEFSATDNSEFVLICAALEAELMSLGEEEAAEFLQELGLAEPGLNRMIRSGYKLLGLETYFTAGEKEVRAWTVNHGAKAPQAAGVIHTDFEKGFIRAEVISYHDFIQYRGEQGAKEAGVWRLEGREYCLKDGDVIHFRFNV